MQFYFNLINFKVKNIFYFFFTNFKLYFFIKHIIIFNIYIDNTIFFVQKKHSSDFLPFQFIAGKGIFFKFFLIDDNFRLNH